MSEPDCAIIKQDDSVYYGVLMISRKEISSTFLPFKDEEKGLELYTHLVERHDNWILSCHHLISIINIKNKLSRQLPELYLHLFKGLINNAISNKSRHPIFPKSIISKSICNK
ncbi:hypothetical protein Gotur_018418 [Gossypium turneri]